MKIFLLRHGQTTVDGALIGRCDPDLSAHGIAAISAWREWFTQQPESAELVCSTRRRAQHSAALLAACARNAAPDSRLDEMHFGDFDGRQVSELCEDPAYRQWLENWTHAAPPGGESLPEVQSRVLDWLTQICTHSAPVVVAVSHATPIRLLLAHALGRPLTRLYDTNVGLASLHGVALQGGSFAVSSVRCTPLALDESRNV